MVARRILFINVLVLLGILVMAWSLVSNWRGFEAEESLEGMVAQVRGTTSAEGMPAIPETGAQDTLFHDFFVIADRNLFSPERRPEADEDQEAEAVEEAPEFPKRPEMNGAATLGGQIRAFMTVFESSKAQGSPLTVGMGDMVQGYAVAEITESTVTLKWNDSVEVIDMMDATPPQRAGRAPSNTAAVNIIRIGSRVAAVEATTTEPGAEEGGRAGQGVPAAGPAVRGRVGRGGPSPQSRLGRSGRPIPNRPVDDGVSSAIAASGAIIPQVDRPQER
ncbi:MAG: hypothetical protein JSU96_17815 [Acidobacteriota bacterium]|nr:MAG: hypothetical protein JSU96_17815 [Acidobacteriota bacterium]